MRVGQLGLIVMTVAFAVFTLTNGVYMLVSPRAWYRLPGWIRASGPLSEKKYSTGWGALQIRLLGLLIVGFWLCVSGSILFDEFFRP